MVPCTPDTLGAIPPRPVTLLARCFDEQQRAHLKRTPLIAAASLPITVVCISDTHTTRPAVPAGNLLHAGDLTSKESLKLQAQLDWLGTLPHGHKVVISGNHDLLLDSLSAAQFPDRAPLTSPGGSGAELAWGNVVYLGNSSVTHMLPCLQYPPVRAFWSGLVPEGTDVLLTHGPPRGHLDDDGRKGCPQLLREIWRARPRLVVCGHVRAGRGKEDWASDAVQAAYDGVVAGEKGLWAGLWMVLLLLCRRVWEVMGLPVWRRSGPGTVVVNAAVVKGRANEGTQEPVVLKL